MTHPPIFWRSAGQSCLSLALLVLLALLPACGTRPRSSAPLPPSTAPAVQGSVPAVQLHYGRVTAIDPLRSQAQGTGAVTGPWRESFRIMVQLENGIQRAYEVPTPGELRVGDRVRIENSQIFRQ